MKQRDKQAEKERRRQEKKNPTLATATDPESLEGEAVTEPPPSTEN